MNIAYRPQVVTWAPYTKNSELYEIQRKMIIEIQSREIEGTLIYTILPGYITDFRSGPSIVNPFIPKIGDMDLALAWMIHDVNYHGFLSKELADKLLREMLENAGIGKFKRNAVYFAVKDFANGHYNTLDEDQGPIYNHNKSLVKLQWFAKGQLLKSFNGTKLTARI